MPDGRWLARACAAQRLAASGNLLMAHHDGFAVTYSTISDDEARALLRVPRPPFTPAKRAFVDLLPADECAADALAGSSAYDGLLHPGLSGSRYSSAAEE